VDRSFRSWDRVARLRLHVLENNLSERLGHFLSVTRGLRREAEARGVGARVYANAAAPREILDLVEGMPVFEHCSWEGEDAPDALGSMERLGADFAASCRAIEDVGGDDLLLVPTALQDQVQGLALYLESLPPGERPRVVLNFFWSNWERRADRAEAIRRACARLRQAAGPGRLLLSVATDELAASLRRVGGEPVERLPLPANYGTERPLGAPALRASPKVVILGRSLARKGSAALGSIVLRVRLAQPLVRFFVQATPNMPAVARLGMIPGVTVHRGELDEATYLEQIRSADIVLLPYQARDYAGRTSGIFAECAALGRVAVVPSGTWMSEQLERGRAAGVAYQGEDPRSVARAVVQAVRDRAALSELALERARYWWECESVSAYVDRVFGYFGVGEGRG